MIRPFAAAIAGLALVRALLAIGSGDVDHRGGAVVLVALAVVLLATAAALREELGGAVRGLAVLAALGALLAAWGEWSLAAGETVGEVLVAHDRVNTGGAVVSAAVAAAAVAALVGRRAHWPWAVAAIGASLLVPPFVAPAIGLPLLLLGLRDQSSVESPPSTAMT